MAYPKDDTAMGLSVSRSIGDNHFNIDGKELMIATPEMKKLVLEEKQQDAGATKTQVKMEPLVGEDGAMEEAGNTLAELPKGDSFILVSRKQLPCQNFGK